MEKHWKPYISHDMCFLDEIWRKIWNMRIDLYWLYFRISQKSLKRWFHKVFFRNLSCLIQLQGWWNDSDSPKCSELVCYISSQDPLDASELKFPKSDLKELSSEADETHGKKTNTMMGPIVF